MSFAIHSGAIDPARLRGRVEDETCGGVVWFEGRVRDHNEGRRVLRLEYEVYHPLALSEGERILDEARVRWPARRICCVHSEGLLKLGEIAVVVGVAAPHRDVAFAAARYVIDEAKRRLPIWKLEHYADGERHWVGCHREASADSAAGTVQASSGSSSPSSSRACAERPSG